MKKYIILGLILAASPIWAIEHEEKPKSKWSGWESHVRIGSQTYLNEFTDDPGSAPLVAYFIGYHLSDHSVIGVNLGLASYEITQTKMNPERSLIERRDKEEVVGSILGIYQYRFRVQEKFQPYLEGGLGVADPVIGYDKGMKFAASFALGAFWRFNEKWAASIESRGVYWDQDNTSDFIFEIDGEDVSITSSEFSIGIGYLF